MSKSSTPASYGATGGELTPGKWLRQQARWLENSDSTDPAIFLSWLFDEDLLPRKLKPRLLVTFLVLQAIGCLLQLHLVSDIGHALVDFEASLALNCNPKHLQHDICIDPSWTLSYFEVLHVPVGGNATFTFTTKSQPPTFLMAVEPQSQATPAWALQVQGVDGQCVYESTRPLARQIKSDLGHGIFHTVEQNSCAQTFRDTGSWYSVLNAPSFYSSSGPDWRAVLTVEGAVALQVTSVDLRVYVVDATVEHLQDIHRQNLCSFAWSWKNFNQRHSGVHHSVLLWTWRAGALSFLVSLALTALVLHRFYYYIEGGKLLRRVVMLKLLAQDLPLQTCVVAYLYGWYSTDGLRCQLCLFGNPQHCGREHALHWGNVLICGFAVASALFTQLLLRSPRGQREFLDWACSLFARGMLFGVSVLPLSVALYLSVFWFHYDGGVWHIVAICLTGALPASLGLMTLCCCPFQLCLKTKWGSELCDGCLERLGIDPTWL